MFVNNGIVLGVDPIKRGFRLTTVVDAGEQWYRIPVGDKFLMKTIYNQYLFINSWGVLVIH